METMARPAHREGDSVANPGNKFDMSRRDFVKTVGIGIGALQTVAAGAGLLQLTACGGSPVEPPTPQIVSWPIAEPVFTTAQQQVCPVAVPASAPPINPGDVGDYARYGYSAWGVGAPLSHPKR
jgi:hypothetical protein